MKSGDIRFNETIDFDPNEASLFSRFVESVSEIPPNYNYMYELTFVDQNGVENIIYRPHNSKTLSLFETIADDNLLLFANDDEFDFGESDSDLYKTFSTLKSIKLVEVPRNLRNHMLSVGNFPYILQTPLYDLSRFQIFNIAQKEEFSRENCFVYALRRAGIDKLTLSNIIFDLNDMEFVSTKGIEHIAKKFGLHLKITVIYDGHASEYQSEIGYKDIPVINLLIYRGHIMLNERIKFNLRNPFKPTTKTPTISRILKRYIDDKSVFKPLSMKVAKWKPAENEIVFAAQEINFRRYRSFSENPISKFYSSVKDLYQISGNFQAAIKKCLYGGRPLFSKKQLVDEEVVHLDINSLYPFALSQLFIQTGKAQAFKPGTSIDFVLSHSFARDQISRTRERFISSAYMKVKILNIEKKRRLYMIPGLKVGNEIWVDLLTLEGLIRWNGISVELIGGFYYSSDRDYRIKKLIFDLYHQRLNAKSVEEKRRLKLILNKIYGFTLYKQRITKKEIIKNEDVEAFVIKHINKLHTTRKYDKDHMEVTLFKNYSDSYNMANLGVSILSMARRILFYYIYTLEDAGVEVLYSKTDSIIIRKKDLDKFVDLFPNAIGNGIGQFKFEYDVEGFEFAQKAIILGKDRYCLKLDEENYHFRYGGISRARKSEIIKNGVWEFFTEKLEEMREISQTTH